MQIFYKDKKNLFECKVSVEGANIKDTSARLVLKFNESKQNSLFYGIIKEDGYCSFEIPALKEVKDLKGEAIIEVIAESMFFEAAKTEFEVKQSKTIKVEMVEKKPENKTKVIVEAIKNSQRSSLKEKLINIFEISKTKKLSSEKKYTTSSKLVKEVFEKVKSSITEKEYKSFELFLNTISPIKLKKIKEKL